jgi:hypothetical protein
VPRRNNIKEGYLIAKPAGFPGVEIPLLSDEECRTRDGTSMSAAETARMMPQLSAASVRQAMRWAGDERRLGCASAAVLAFMRQHSIAATWGRSDLASVSSADGSMSTARKRASKDDQ